jgi:hypothetical protein
MGSQHCYQRDFRAIHAASFDDAERLCDSQCGRGNGATSPHEHRNPV